MYKLFFLFASCAIAMPVLTFGQVRTENDPSHPPPTFMGGPKYKKDKTATSRNVKGTVTDEFGHPLQGALVTLTDKKTNAKTTYITKVDGKYNFADLSFTVDYDLTAKYQASISQPRKLSQYDRTVEVVRILQIDENAPVVPATTAQK